MSPRPHHPDQRTPEQICEGVVFVMLHTGGRKFGKEVVDVDKLHKALPFALSALAAHGHSPSGWGFYRNIVTQRFTSLDRVINSLAGFRMVDRGNPGDQRSTIRLNLASIDVRKIAHDIPEYGDASSAACVLWAAYDSGAVWRSW